jgi:hypothetical protein
MVGLTSKFEKGLLRLFVLLCAAVPSCECVSTNSLSDLGRPGVDARLRRCVPHRKIAATGLQTGPASRFVDAMQSTPETELR